MLALALLAGPTAFAQADLIDGQPEFTDCLEANSDCRERFYRFLGQAMVEQGFTMQHHSLSGSALINPIDGVTVGGSLSTFPFGPPRQNLSGKEENTGFSPVYPRLFAAYSTTTDGGLRWSAGLFGLPPVPVSGATAWTLGADGAAALPVGEHAWLGAEADFSYVRVMAPITASEDQFENRDDIDNPDNLREDTYESVCASSEQGCIDTFTVANAGLRLGASWRVGSRLTPYVKVGLASLNERLYVMYDDTLWGLNTGQLSLHAGSGFNPFGNLMLSLGGSLAYKPPGLSYESKAPLFYKVEGALSWTFSGG